MIDHVDWILIQCSWKWSRRTTVESRRSMLLSQSASDVKRLHQAYQRNFLEVEFLLSVVGAALLATVLKLVVGEHEWSKLIAGNRAALYLTVAQIAGSLFGFVLTTVSVLIVFAQMPRFDLLKK